MPFDFGEFVRSGRAEEIANIGVARAVARAKALGLPVYGPTADNKPQTAPDQVNQPQDPAARIDAAAQRSDG